MKEHKFYFLLISLFTIISCKENCESNPNRPEIPADGMKWVEVSNNTPKFKITIENSDGTTTVDTIQGAYTLTVKDGPQAEDECERIIQYKVYENWLSLPYGASANYGRNFNIDNFDEKGYRGHVEYYESYVTQETILDTAQINGIIYTNVFKSEPLGNKFYYSKGVGFIYIKTSVTLELLN